MVCAVPRRLFLSISWLPLHHMMLGLGRRRCRDRLWRGCDMRLRRRGKVCLRRRNAIRSLPGLGWTRRWGLHPSSRDFHRGAVHEREAVRVGDNGTRMAHERRWMSHCLPVRMSGNLLVLGMLRWRFLLLLEMLWLKLVLHHLLMRRWGEVLH